MVTMVSYEGIWEFDNTTRVFRIMGGNEDMPILWVQAFDKGIATIDVVAGTHFDTVANIIEGCFAESSNFGAEVLKAYKCDENTSFVGIELEFNGVTLIVTKENFDKQTINKAWWSQYYGQTRK